MKEFKFPDVGEGIHEGKIVKWRVTEGESVKADQTIVEVETDKAIVELPSPVAGRIASINFHEGTDVKVGETLVTISDDRASRLRLRSQNQPECAQTARHAPAVIPSAAATSNLLRRLPVLATPVDEEAGRVSSESISQYHAGSGPGGRITEDDVKGTKTPRSVGPKSEMPAACDRERYADTSQRPEKDDSRAHVIFEDAHPACMRHGFRRCDGPCGDTGEGESCPCPERDQADLPAFHHQVVHDRAPEIPELQCSFR